MLSSHILVGALALMMASPSAGFHLQGPLLRAPARKGLGGLCMVSKDDVLLKMPSGKGVSLVAQNVEFQETVETEVVETKVTKGPGITVDKAAMGQAPFWVAVIGGMTVLKMVRQKAAGRSVLDNKDDKFIPQNEKEEKELKVFACEGCGYELMPARGREGKFFAKDFKCPICGAPKEKFWDVNDPDDPRNQEPEPEEEAPKASSPNKDEGGDSKGKKKEE